MINEGQNHPLRALLSQEMHVRKMPPVVPGERIAQVLVMPADGEGWAPIEAHLAALCAHAGQPCDSKARYLRGRIDTTDFAWERHSEFATFTFLRQVAEAPLFDDAPFAALPAGWLESLPGRILRATRIAYLPAATELPEGAALGDLFELEDLVVCDVAGGRARVYSDFRVHGDRFGRLLVVDRGLKGREAALALQRLQELGNYRNMALLGLPVAQRLTPEVSALEERLAALTGAIAGGGTDDDAALAELSFLSAELARLMAATRYRMSATNAYAEIVSDRLRSLEVAAVPGYPTLIDFTDRRLVPAVRTCTSFSARLDDLSRRVGWTSDLLRTRVDTAVAAQSRDLLASMNRRTDLSLRLQQTVEGLSVVAISYYAVGLAGYVLKGVPALASGHRAELVLALAVPLIVLAAWLGMRRVRRRIHRRG